MYHHINAEWAGFTACFCSISLHAMELQFADVIYDCYCQTVSWTVSVLDSATRHAVLGGLVADPYLNECGVVMSWQCSFVHWELVYGPHTSSCWELGRISVDSINPYCIYLQRYEYQTTTLLSPRIYGCPFSPDNVGSSLADNCGTSYLLVHSHWVQLKVRVRERARVVVDKI